MVFRVPQWQSANLEPAVRAVGTTATLLDVVGLPGFN
jgi:hypothetical protein